VICGHIHVPAIRRVEGIDYYNCGDWVEHCTALVEHMDGRIELVRAAGAAGAHARSQSRDVARTNKYGLEYASAGAARADDA
jgi:hypothetical protein